MRATVEDPRKCWMDPGQDRSQRPLGTSSAAGSKGTFITAIIATVTMGMALPHPNAENQFKFSRERI